LRAERICPAERGRRGHDILHARSWKTLLDMARLLSLLATLITTIHYTTVIITSQYVLMVMTQRGLSAILVLYWW
jgi:hypothetical protein